jgi:hypothetical protein
MPDLTIEEQLSILNSHKKNLMINTFNLNTSLIEENAKTSPMEQSIKMINDQLADIAKQQAALDAEIAKITPATPTA